MPPFAICSNKLCVYIFDMLENTESGFKIPPQPCPECMSRVILYCLSCHAPILEKPSQQDPRCAGCDAPLKQDPVR